MDNSISPPLDPNLFQRVPENMMNFNTTVNVSQNMNIYSSNSYTSGPSYAPTSQDLAQSLMTEQSHTTAEALLQNPFNRGGWPSQYSNEPREFYYVVNHLCNFVYSSSSQELTGYSPQELVGRSITEFIHDDDIDTFVRQFNVGFTRQQFRLYYRFRKKNDEYIMLEAQGHSYYQAEDHQRKCFCLARPYLTKTTSILDAFLQIKMENEILKRQLSELGNLVQDNSWIGSKIVEDLEPFPNFLNNHSSPKSTIPTTCANQGTSDISKVSMEVKIASPEQHKRSYLSDENSCGQESNIKSRKKKKQKNDESLDHVCTECGTVESPEWRKGPQGPKTLCNACGLRWAKRAKRELQTFRNEDTNSS